MFFPLNSHVIPMIFPLRSLFILRIFSGYSHFLPMIFPRYSHKTFGAVLKSGYPQPSSISRMRFSLKSTIQRAGGTHFFHVERGRFYLVGGLEHLDYFPINIGLLIIPSDELIFFRGVAKNHQPDYFFFSSLQVTSQRRFQRSPEARRCAWIWWPR